MCIISKSFQGLSMCGINGIMHFNGEMPDRQVLFDMNTLIQHRGPDAGNIQIFNGIGLGHRRLSILDLSHHANRLCRVRTIDL